MIVFCSSTLLLPKFEAIRTKFIFYFFIIIFIFIESRKKTIKENA